jgi:UDP-glucose 4-epimerase
MTHRRLDRRGYSGLNVLVTGADGFIGSHLTEMLVRAGANVTALALYNSFDSHGWLDDLPREIREELRLVRGDVRDGAFIGSTVAGHDVVFHLAALIAIPHSYVAAQSYVDTNVVGTLNVLEAARVHGVQRVVHTSTSEVYGTAIVTPIDESHPLQGQSPYSASKIGADMMAEAFARSYDLPVVILRPFNTYGPRQSERAVIPTVIRQVLDDNAKKIRIGDLTPRRDFTFVEDTAAVFLTVGIDDRIAFGTPYNAGSGRSVTVSEVIDLVQSIAGTDKPIEQDAMRVRPINSEVRVLLADASRLTAATGWFPQVALRDGLDQTVGWWRRRMANGRVRPELTFAT